MQSMSHNAHNAYKRETVSEQWMEQARIRSDVYEGQGDQWAILRHEVEEGDMQRRVEQKRSGWKRRNTDEEAISSQTTTDTLASNN